MGVLRPATCSINAQIPYLRGDLVSLFVDYSARILGEEVVDRRDVAISNGRTGPGRPLLEREGFELFAWPSDTVRTRNQELQEKRIPQQIPEVLRSYWNDTLPFIKRVSGAREIYPLNASAVRFSTRALRQGMMTPAGWVHLDYDPEEAEVQLKETLELHSIKPAPYGRFVLYQGWRSLSPPPQDYPLALCDARTADDKDIIPIDYHMAVDEGDVTYRSRGSRFNPEHRWWYFPDMTSEEMILFKGFDSAWQDRQKTLHVAFEDKTVAGAPPRVSIETRYFALFD